MSNRDEIGCGPRRRLCDSRIGGRAPVVPGGIPELAPGRAGPGDVAFVSRRWADRRPPVAAANCRWARCLDCSPLRGSRHEPAWCSSRPCSPNRRVPASHRAALAQRGANERVIPVVTSCAALAALVLPLAVLGSPPGLELLHPMALVLLGGLVTTLVTLLRAARPLPAPAPWSRRTRPTRRPEWSEPVPSDRPGAGAGTWQRVARQRQPDLRVGRNRQMRPESGTSCPVGPLAACRAIVAGGAAVVAVALSASLSGCQEVDERVGRGLRARHRGGGRGPEVKPVTLAEEGADAHRPRNRDREPAGTTRPSPTPR